jgi:hypothetical protein
MGDTDPWSLYAATRDRLVELFRATPASAEHSVPLTPAWTVRDTAAHVCGINADVASGRRTQLGTDERTSHQVAIRAHLRLDDICDEWLSHEAAMRTAIEEDPFLGERLAADLVVHLHDLQHAVGVPIRRDDTATVAAAGTYATVVVELVPQRCGIAIGVDLETGARFGPAGASGVLTVRATPWDFLRSVTGRRSRDQVAALDWSGDPSPILDHFCPSGPLRVDDAPL